MIRFSFLVSLMLFAIAASAQAPSAADFNAAWKEYQAAKELAQRAYDRQLSILEG